MSIAKHSAKNYTWMMVLEAIKAGTLFVSAHLLGDQGRGLLALAYVLPNILGIFGGLGMETAAAFLIGKEGGKEGDKEGEGASRIASTAIWSAFGLGVVFAILMIFVYETMPAVINAEVSPLLRYLVLAQLPIAMASTVFTALFVHRRWFGRRYALDILRRVLGILSLAVLGLLILPEEAALALAEALAGAQLVIALLAFGLGLYFLRDWLVLPSLKLFRRMLRIGWANSLAISAMYLLHYGDQYLLDQLGGPESVKLVGVYTAAFALLAAVTGVSRSIASVMFRVSVESSREDSDRLVAQIGRRTTLLMLILALGAALVSPLAVLLLPPEFEVIQWIFPILLISAPLYAMSQIAEQVTVNRGRFLLAAWPPALAVAVNFGLNFVLIPEHGLFGAAWATVVAFAVLLIGRLLIVARITSGGVVRELFAFKMADFGFLRQKVVDILRPSGRA